MDEPLLLLVAAALFALVAAGAVAVWTARVVWNRLRHRLASGDPRGFRVLAMRPRASTAWCSVHASRRRLRGAVTSAERTVAAAGEARAPLGELPALCRDLRGLQRDIDRRLLLAAAHGQRPDPPTAAQVATIRANAEKVRGLAARALEEATEPALDRLTQRIDSEACALDAGIASWRRQVEPTRPI